MQYFGTEILILANMNYGFMGRKCHKSSDKQVWSKSEDFLIIACFHISYPDTVQESNFAVKSLKIKEEICQ